jgi:hypothetical protein
MVVRTDDLRNQEAHHAARRNARWDQDQHPHSQQLARRKRPVRPQRAQQGVDRTGQKQHDEQRAHGKLVARDKRRRDLDVVVGREPGEERGAKQADQHGPPADRGPPVTSCFCSRCRR